jgi:hypothetical protein
LPPACAAMQRRATFIMRSMVPTEVPPYFWTINISGAEHATVSVG